VSPRKRLIDVLQAAINSGNWAAIHRAALAVVSFSDAQAEMMSANAQLDALEKEFLVNAEEARKIQAAEFTAAYKERHGPKGE
jgi:hypothetical protein